MCVYIHMYVHVHVHVCVVICYTCTCKCRLHVLGYVFDREYVTVFYVFRVFRATAYIHYIYIHVYIYIYIYIYIQYIVDYYSPILNHSRIGSDLYLHVMGSTMNNIQ